MTKYLMMVQTEPVEGREEEYHAWYNDVHLPDMLSVEGITGANRYQLLGAPASVGELRRYIAVFEVVADDPLKVLDTIIAGNFRASDGIEQTRTIAGWYEPVA